MTFVIIQDDIISWFNGPEFDEVAYEAFKDMIPEVEAYAQQNAPWDDISGDARRGLTAEAAYEGGEVFLTLFHTVDHGYWLELIQNGNFAIILPTLEAMGPSVLGHVAEAVNNSRAGI